MLTRSSVFAVLCFAVLCCAGITAGVESGVNGESELMGIRKS